MYLKNTRIYLDPKEEEEFNNSKSDFLKFLERDEKFSLKNCFEKSTKVDPIHRKEIKAQLLKLANRAKQNVR